MSILLQLVGMIEVWMGSRRETRENYALALGMSSLALEYTRLAPPPRTKTALIKR